MAGTKLEPKQLKYSDTYFKAGAANTLEIKALAGTTLERPVDTQIGLCYFDTDLNKPVWHKGSNLWVLADGVEA